MPADRKAYMRQYMAAKRAAEKARKTDVKTSPHEPVNTATPQPQAQPGVADWLDEVVERAFGGIAGDHVVRDEGGAITSVRLTGAAVHRPRPSFLAAPDDDCGACGHDRQLYHLPAELPCRGPAPYARGGVCRCPAFVDSANPF